MLQDGEDGSQKMIKVLQHQRDRARQKTEELQKEASALQFEITNMETEATASRADNVALVERIQFLQVSTICVKVQGTSGNLDNRLIWQIYD